MLRKAIATLVGITTAFATLLTAIVTVGINGGIALLLAVVVATFVGIPMGGMAHDAILGKSPRAYWRDSRTTIEIA